jgi:AraC family transcriptional regulator of arabinose operon
MKKHPTTNTRPKKKDSGSPQAGPLMAQEIVGVGEQYGAYRPNGTRDWLAIYTVAGKGRFTYDGGETLLTTGDLFIVRPGTPQDYGTELTEKKWHNLWSHFVPRGDALAWLNWPQVSPGVMVLHVRDDLQPLVLEQLREMERYVGRTIGRSQELGLNALERALLIADACNPTSATARHDPRIRRAIDHLLANLTDPPSLESLAEVAGLSRSRFALLFEEQVGQPPGRFVEEHRLFRAKRLLEYTRHSLQEIADELGFSSPFYLSLRFKRWFGASPSEWRKRMTNDQASMTNQ